MSNDALEKACLGLPKSKGGLNLPDIKKLAAAAGTRTSGRREEILNELCDKYGLEDAKKNLMENYDTVVDLDLSKEELVETIKHYLGFIMENEDHGDDEFEELEF